MIAKRKNLARKKQLKSYFKRDDRPRVWFCRLFWEFCSLPIIGFLIISNWRISKKRSDLGSQIENLQEQIKTLEDQKSKLEAGISQGQSETFLEEQAREKLGLKKPGEEVVAVLPPKETAEQKPQENKSLWQKILEKLGF